MWFGRSIHASISYRKYITLLVVSWLSSSVKYWSKVCMQAFNWGNVKRIFDRCIVESRRSLLLVSSTNFDSLGSFAVRFVFMASPTVSA